MIINMKGYAEDSKKFTQIAELSVKCKCGHSVLIGTHGKKICTWCDRLLYNDKKMEFKDKLKSAINKTK